MDILLHLPPPLKSLQLLLDEIFSSTLQALQVASSDLPLDLSAWEELVSSWGSAFERALTKTLLQACVRTENFLCIGGRLHQKSGTCATTYHTLRGPVELTRTLYRPVDNPLAKSVDPIAIRGGMIRKTWLPATAEAIGFLVQQQPLREAVASAHLLGVLPYSRSSFDDVCQSLGEIYEENSEEIEESLIRAWKLPQEATGIVLSLDRVSMPFEEPKKRTRGRPKKKSPKRSIQRVWHMAYCATVSVHDAKGKTLHTFRYGAMPNDHTESLVEGMRDDVRALLEANPKLRVLVICDGAAELWKELNIVNEEFLKQAIDRLVDLWHLLEKLGKALRQRYDEQRARMELSRWRMQLLNKAGQWKKLLAEIQSWKMSRGSGQNCPVHEALTFLRNQGEAGRLEYTRARAQGQPVGSGVVEATCKVLVGVRFKRGGARWKEERGGRVLKLRAVAQSGRWRGAMALLREKTRGEVLRVA